MDGNFDMGLLAVFLAHVIFIPVVLRLFFDGLQGEVLHVDVGKCNCIVISSNVSLHISVIVVSEWSQITFTVY